MKSFRWYINNCDLSLEQKMQASAIYARVYTYFLEKLGNEDIRLAHQKAEQWFFDRNDGYIIRQPIGFVITHQLDKLEETVTNLTRELA